MLVGVASACGGGGGDGPTAPGPVSRIDVSTSSLVLNTIGATEGVTASAKDASGKAVTSATVTWTSDNTAIATVSGAGNSAMITSVAPGATVIHARVGSVNADVSVQVRGVRSLQVSPTVATIRAGDTQNFSTTFDADAGISTAVTWSSGNTTIATVSSTGVVTGVSAGTTTIRAASVFDPRVSSTATINVTPARGVVVTPFTAAIATAEQLTLQATVNIEQNASTAVTWRTSSASIATVNANGRVTGIAFGIATITAVSVADTTLRGTAVISVVPVIRSVTVTPTSAILFATSTQQLTSAVVAEASLPATVTWRTSNAAVATVSASGLVTGVSIGSATITAVSTADTTKRASSAITVASRPLTVTISPRTNNLNPGASMTLTATVTADAGVSTAVTWSSSVASVATVSQSGVVSGLTNGSTIITATSQADNTKRDTVTVTVVPRLAGSWAATRLGGALYDDLISIIGFSPTNAFAVNAINGGASGGDIYRWNGSAWVLSLSGASLGTKFQAVHGSSSTFVLAVGTNGVIARWDGNAWTAMTSGSTRTLRAVFVEGVNNAIAVGDNGTALRFTGTVWQTQSTGTTERLNGVWLFANNGYAVGTNGKVVRYNGVSWTNETVPTSDDLNAVSGLSSGVITIVGNFGNVIRNDGTGWLTVDNNGVSGNLHAIVGSEANGGRFYIGGDDGVYQLDAVVLSNSNASYPVATYGAHVDANGVLWTSGQRGAVQRRTGTAWETLNLAPDLLDVWTTSATNSWAVGEFGFIYRWNGSTWARQTTPSLASLYSVWALSSTDAFVGGDNGTVLRWNGTTWTAMTFPTSSRVYALWGTAANNVFAATDIGELLRWNGTTWTLQTTTPGNTALFSLYGVSATDVYAAGSNGLVMRYNGTTWSTFSAPDAVTMLFGLWMSASNNIFALGSDIDLETGIAFNYAPSSWQSMNVGAVKALTSVWGPSPVDVYATGDAGTILRYNGTSWQAATTGVTDLLWAVSGAPDASGGAFAVGLNGTVLTGSSGAGALAALTRGNVRRGSLEPSAAARRDPKKSGAAASGVARRTRGAATAAVRARQRLRD